jgi:dihydrolipoamide dehydrogenase
LAQKSFEKKGIIFKLNASVDKIEKQKTRAQVFLKTDQGIEMLEAEKVIVAIGIRGNTENLGLENTKVKTEHHHIEVNEWCETAEPNIYAIGDVAGPPWLAHKASHEGILCVEKIAGLHGVRSLDKHNIPSCTYSIPQIASLGITEAKAQELGREIKVGRFSPIGNGKALALGEGEGLIKTIFDAQTGELLGAHMMGAEVTELIQGFVIAKNLETTESELMHSIFPHPTLSEMMHESVLNAYGQTIHM